jgi:WD40 repeat protein
VRLTSPRLVAALGTLGFAAARGRIHFDRIGGESGDGPLGGDDDGLPMRDGDPWLSPDGHVIVFASRRAGTYDIYAATR